MLADREVFTRAEFEAVRDEVSASIVDALFGAVSLLAATLGAARAAEKAIKAASNSRCSARSPTRASSSTRSSTPASSRRPASPSCGRLPVYLRGISHRVGKLSENPGRDRVWMTEVQPATERYRSAGGELPLARGRPGPHPSRPLDARGAAHQPVRAAARHGGAGEPAAHRRCSANPKSGATR